MNPLIRISASMLLAAGTIVTASAAPHQTASEVKLNIDGMAASYVTEQPTVGAFLQERGIVVKQEDMVNFPEETKLARNHDVVISLAVPVRIQADGRKLTVHTLTKDVRSLLAEQGIILGENDTMNVALSDEVTKGMQITIQRVTFAESTAFEPVAFKEKKVKTDDLLKGKEKVGTAGAAGSLSILTRQVFVDGELAAETETEAITQKPVDKTILVGTRAPARKVRVEEKKKPAVNTKKTEASVKQSTAKNTTTKKTTTTKSSSSSEKNWKTFKLSFYTNLPSENGGWTITASGKKMKYGMAASNYYSIGKKIHLEGWGEFTIEDRGGPNFNSSTRLDIFIPRKSGESNSAYLYRVNMMGLKSVKGYVK